MIRALALSLLLVPTPAQDRAKSDAVLLKFGRIVTGSGPDLAPGMILVEHGKIRKIGRDVAAPEGAKVVDLSSYTAMPGMVDAASGIGVRGNPNEETSEITPRYRVADSVDARDPRFQQAVQVGVTTLLIEPGNRNVIGGLGSVFKPSGRSAREMLVREDVALKAVMGRLPAYGNMSPRRSQASFFSRRPTTRMGVVWEFRKAYLDAKRYREEKPATPDEAMEILLKTMDRKLPVRISASRSFDIETALRLSEEFGFVLQIEEGEEAWRYVDELAQRKVTVALRPSFRTSDLYLPEGGEIRFDTFARLAAAGVSVSLLPADLDPRESMLAMAALAVKYGAKREDAIRAVTIHPAEMLGVGERVGTLEEGKDADIVVLTGDPLDATSRIEWVFVDGRRVHGKELGDY